MATDDISKFPSFSGTGAVFGSPSGIQNGQSQSSDMTAYYKAEIERLSTALRRSEEERQQEKLLLSDAFLQAEQLAFNVEKNAQEKADKIVSDALEQAQQIKAAAQKETQNIRAQIDSELGVARTVLRELTQGTENARQSILGQFASLDRKLTDISTSLNAVNFAPPPNEEPQDEKGNYQGVYEFLKNAEKSEVVNGRNVYDDPHMLFGD